MLLYNIPCTNLYVRKASNQECTTQHPTSFLVQLKHLDTPRFKHLQGLNNKNAKHSSQNSTWRRRNRARATAIIHLHSVSSPSTRDCTHQPRRAKWWATTGVRPNSQHNTHAWYESRSEVSTSRAGATNNRRQCRHRSQSTEQQRKQPCRCSGEPSRSRRANPRGCLRLNGNDVLSHMLAIRSA